MLAMPRCHAVQDILVLQLVVVQSCLIQHMVAWLEYEHAYEKRYSVHPAMRVHQVDAVKWDEMRRERIRTCQET